MQKIFFIGSLKLNFLTDFEFSLQEFDKHFEKQVLPVAKQIDIRVNGEKFPFILSESQFQEDGMKIYYHDNNEVRLYEKKNEHGIISTYDLKDNIQVYIPDRNVKIMQKFRPWFHIHLEELLLNNQALILHSASIEHCGGGILFSAPSGTGKTTQTDLWHKYKKGVMDINGDRTVLQYLAETWYACGFPIYGSTVRCQQKAVPVKAIVFLKQGKDNEIKILSKREKVLSLYKETTVLSYSDDYVKHTLDLLEQLVADVDIIQLSCDISQDAVDVLHDYLYKEF